MPLVLVHTRASHRVPTRNSQKSRWKMILRGLRAILGRALLPVRELAANCVHWPEVVKEGLRGIVYLARDEVGEVAVGNDLGRDVSRPVGGRHKGWRDALLEQRDPIEAVVP